MHFKKNFFFLVTVSMVLLYVCYPVTATMWAPAEPPSRNVIDRIHNIDRENVKDSFIILTDTGVHGSGERWKLYGDLLIYERFAHNELMYKHIQDGIDRYEKQGNEKLLEMKRKQLEQLTADAPGPEIGNFRKWYVCRIDLDDKNRILQRAAGLDFSATAKCDHLLFLSVFLEPETEVEKMKPSLAANPANSSDLPGLRDLCRQLVPHYNMEGFLLPDEVVEKLGPEENLVSSLIDNLTWDILLENRELLTSIADQNMEGYLVSQ